MQRIRNTYREIDLSKIQDNVKALGALLPENGKVMGVLKADAYGHGSVKVAEALINVGVDFLMVALLEEALELREGGIDVPILVIGRVNPAFAPLAAEKAITLSVFQIDWVEKVETLDFAQPLNIHLEFETGMNRTGICTMSELDEIVTGIHANPNLKITGAYQHFATADEVASPLYYAQYERYEEMLQHLIALHDEKLILHVGNSAAGIQFSKEMLHYTRIGVSLYGMYPSKDVKALTRVELKQAMSLYSELIQVKHVAKGESISYGATYTFDESTWVGTVPIGYADGWSRSLQGFEVLVGGKRAEIIGRICMDSMMVKLDQAYPVGERVTLAGRDGEEFITFDDIADHIETICYEIPTKLTKRMAFEYK